jgi:hypothetical protein
MSERNRSQGWQYAKLSGHKNENNIKNRLENDTEYINSFCEIFNKNNILSIEIGGINETNVSSVLNGTTKSKTDLVVVFGDNDSKNISIKKSESGQVYLIKTSRFISGYEKLFENIPDIVKKSLLLYFGEDDDTKDILINENSGLIESKVRSYEKRKNRLTWDTLKIHNEEMAHSMLEWIKSNIGNITRFCFSTGLSNDKNSHANYVWYMNTVDNNNLNTLYSIDDIIDAVEKNKDNIIIGPRNGGTTIVLPFGHLQWHKESMQFHHKKKSILNILK